ncbi:hypothetical protein DFJ58DRAFT_912297 [Suillus subalutaceus]|uniref:uncharacterized protein n=1 Tax=Suillus subalutaceus TaxID=48586 RepID=UPI001B8659E1|nr:uncharacterized protein DFJ58DRAFT_912297 [Suillus subalutaceus]KAG1864288.1 hypothetical protein DFJ58DRAFT_912297 [Suillus subalutaceus]
MFTDKHPYITMSTLVLLPKVQKEIPVEIVCDAADSIQYLLQGQIFTSRVEDVMKYITKSTMIPCKSYQEFHDVGAEDFASIEHIVGEMGQLMTKPKLTYDYKKLALVVDMPTTLHEEPFNYLKECITLAIAELPYDRKDHPAYIDVTISALGECAFTERRDHVFNKMEMEITANPEVNLAVIVLIHEAIPFASPLPDSTAHKLLAGDTSELPRKAFVSQRSTVRQFNEPFVVAGHNWCQVHSVEYFVWAKGADGASIDVRNNNPLLMAHGITHNFTQTLGLTSNMSAVTTMLEKGLGQMRDSMVTLTREHDSDADCSALEGANPTLPIKWGLGASGVLSAIDITAYQRYQTWIRGIKRDHNPLFSRSQRVFNNQRRLMHTPSLALTCPGPKALVHTALLLRLVIKKMC